MKKILTIILAMTMLAAASACGKKVSDGDAGQSVVQGGAAVDEKGNEIIGTTIDGAGAEVDMEKIDSPELKSDNSKAEGEIRSFEVSIDEAKVIEAEIEDKTRKAIVVSFTFKNNSSSPAAFDNALKVTASQEERVLNAKPVSGIEGINTRSGVEIIDSDKTNRVQKVYVLANEDLPVQISVTKPDEQDGEGVTKTFNLK